jgi:3-hydroxybutyryl-CoA dehydrogenase
MIMKFQVISVGASRSFPKGDKFYECAVAKADAVVIVGPRAGNQMRKIIDPSRHEVVLVELETECLGEYTGESRGQEGSNIVGFARFRLGKDEPTPLVELVRQPRTSDKAIVAAEEVFASQSLTTVVCHDFPGRILNRLVRPYYNEVLKRLDEELATAEDLDATLKLGLGYPEGPVELLERTGLADHFDVSQALYEALGDRAFLPARRAQVAKRRSEKREN